MTVLVEYLATHPLAELAMIVSVILAIWYVMQLLRQPSIVGYILSGIVLSPQLNNLIQNQESVQLFAYLGIVMLLFLVGLWLSVRIIRDVGKISLVVGVGQVLFTSLVWVVIAWLLGNDWLTAMFLAIWLTFSSTIVIVKLISDRWDAHKLYGKISLGMLIVQDMIAMMILIAFALISSVRDTGGDMTVIVSTFASIVGAWLIVWLISRYGLHFLLKKFSTSEEYLLLFSIGRALLVAAWFERAGLTMEAGALIAGIALAESSEKFLIVSKIKTLRDFFIALFFVYMWSNLVFDGMMSLWPEIIILSLFVLIGNPLIVFFLMRQFRYDWRTGFMTWLTVAQISEFSFIVMGMGMAMWFITNDSILTIITFVALITMAGSSYLFAYADTLMDRISRYIPQMKKWYTDTETVSGHEYDIIVVGYGDHGQKLCRSLSGHFSILVLEHDPQIVRHAIVPDHVTIIHADVTEDEIRKEVEQYHARFVIVTSSELSVSIASHHYNKHLDRHIIARTKSEKDAIMLYKKGIDIVHVVHEAAVDQTIDLIQESVFDHESVGRYKHRHLDDLTHYIQDSIGAVMAS